MKFKTFQNVVIVSSGDEPLKFLTKKNPYDHIAKNYIIWSNMAEKWGVRIFRARYYDYDSKSNTFLKAYTFLDDSWRLEKNVMPYVVFGKIKTKDAIQALPFLYCMMEKNIRVYNVPDFESQFFDKMQFFSRWNRFMPETYLAESDNEVREYAKFFFHEKERLVVKELHGSGGKNVHIGTLEEFSLDLSYPVFVQRFLRSSGFPTFAGTVSDLRMQFIDHKLVDCFSRVASQGSLFTNTWKGAAVMPVEKKDIPEDVLAIVKEIQHEMKDIKRCFYCLDFFFEDGKPYLLEGGAKPGLSIANNDDERELKVFFRKLTESMLDRTLS